MPLGTPRNVGEVTQAELDTAIATREPALGNPAADGYVPQSTAAGLRSWLNLAVYALIAADNQFTVAQGIRGAASGVAAGLHVPFITGDTLTTMIVGSTALSTRLAIQGTSNSGGGIEGRSNSGIGINGISNTSVGVQGAGATGVIAVSVTGLPFSAVRAGAASDAAVEAERVNRQSSSGTPGAGFGVKKTTLLTSSTTADQTAAEDHTVWSDATHTTRTSKREIWLTRNGTLTLAFSLDNASGSNQTPITVDIPGIGSRRIEYGAADSDGVGYRSLRILN